MRRLFVVMVLGISNLANAGSDNRLMTVETADDLYNRCKPVVEITKGAPVGADDRVVSAATCLSYISGFMDGHNTAVAFIVVKQKGAARTARDFQQTSAFCYNPKVTVGVIVEMVVDVLEKFPDQRKLPAGVVVLRVLRATRPCPV